MGEFRPETRGQDCWVRKIADVLDEFPKRLYENCEKEKTAFAAEFGANYPKAVESLQRGLEQMSAFFVFAAEHRGHLRTTNPTPPAFATVNHSACNTKGGGPGADRGLEASWPRPKSTGSRSTPCTWPGS